MQNRKPAKTISEIELPEGAYKPDFELIDKYTQYSSELLRLSLLGIAGYGFLISEIVMKSNGAMNSCFGICLQQHSILLMCGIISLGIALLLSVLYRLFSTSCIHYQVKILRGMKRMASEDWKTDPAAIKSQQHELDYLREAQKKMSERCRMIMHGSAYALSLGYILIVIVFYLILNSNSQTTVPASFHT